MVCFGPRHDLSLANLAVSQLFENKGALMGASSPHPHGQIWAGDFIPTEVKKESECQRRWRDSHPEALLLHYAQLESAAGARTIIASEHWIVVVPWWALWPFETLLIPRREVRTLPELTLSEADDLAQVLKRLMQAYDALFAAPLPYSMGWHGARRRRRERLATSRTHIPASVAFRHSQEVHGGLRNVRRSSTRSYARGSSSPLAKGRRQRITASVIAPRLIDEAQYRDGGLRLVHIALGCRGIAQIQGLGGAIRIRNCRR